MAPGKRRVPYPPAILHSIVMALLEFESWVGDGGS